MQENLKKCVECKGSGQWPIKFSDTKYVVRDCEACEGTGYIVVKILDVRNNSYEKKFIGGKL